MAKGRMSEILKALCVAELRAESGRKVTEPCNGGPGHLESDSGVELARPGATAGQSGGGSASTALPRHSSSGVPALTPAAAAWTCTRAKRARYSKQLDAARSEAQLRNWLDSRPPAKSSAAIPAAERMAALRSRIAEKWR